MRKKFLLILFLCSSILTSELSARGLSSAILERLQKAVVAVPVADFIANDSIICVGATVSFTDLSLNAPTTWSWTFAGGTPATSNAQNPTVVYSATGAYSVKLVVTNGSGADSLTKTDYIVVSAPPSVTASSATSVCSGVSTTLIAIGSPSGGSYLWQPGNNSGAAVSVSPSTTTLYNVAYTNSCGTATDTVTVFVAPVPELDFSAAVTSGCPTFCTQFLGRSGPANVNIASWDWSFGDGDTASIQSPTHCYTSQGVYSVILTAVSTAGCASTYQVPNLITVYQLPHASFTFSPDPVTILYPTVSFNDNSSGAYQIIKWFWNFGETGDSTSKIENPEHTYKDTGTYCASLVIVDVNGCSDTNKQCFTITPEYSFYIPNAFTPNGDGINDVFTPEGTDFTDYEMYIYDRWGMQLYHTTNIEQGWNGTVNNGTKICMEDSYVYIINVTDNHSVAHRYMGAVYLLK